MAKLRLIAGTINRYEPEEGWANIHLDRSPRKLYGGGSPEIVADIVDLSVIPDGHFDEVRCWHTLEHLRRAHAHQALREFHRVLKSGGTVDVETPDLEWVTSEFVAGRVNWDDFCQNIYGEQLEGEDAELMCHRWGWNPETLSAALVEAGFAGVTPVENGLRFRAVKP